LIEYKRDNFKLDKSTQSQVMLFLNSQEIKVFKLERKNQTETESLSFILLETIRISDIFSILTKKQTKNVVTLQFTSMNGKSTLIIDLITDIDSKSFISKTKQFIEKYGKD
jgi:hypothetical protein